MVECAELVAAPGTCAGCKRAFEEHADEELFACAAPYAPTEPDDADAGAP